MTERLVTDREIEGLLRRLRKLEDWRDGLKIEVPTFARGTFTPTYEGTVTPGSWTYTTNAGFYHLYGNLCFFRLSITAATRPSAPAGNGVIVGLPFTSVADSNTHSACTLDTLNALTLGATCVMLTARIPPNTTRIELIEVLGTAPTVAGNLAATGISATATIRVTGHYIIA